MSINVAFGKVGVCLKSTSIIAVLVAFAVLFTLCMGCKKKDADNSSSLQPLVTSSDVLSDIGASPDESTTAGSGATKVDSSSGSANASQSAPSEEVRIDAGDFEGSGAGSSSSKTSSGDKPPISASTADNDKDVSTSSPDTTQSTSSVVSDKKPSEPSSSSSPAETSSRKVGYDNVSGWSPIMP